MALLQRVVLLEGQRVDRAHEPQLALELAGPGGGGDALGELGRLGGHGGLGLESRSRRSALDGGLEAQLHLGLVELGAPGLLAGLLEAALGVLALAAQLVEADGGGALRLALAAAALAELAELALDDGQAVGDERGEVVDGGLLGVELDAAHLGLAAGLDGALEPGLDLDPAGLEELAALGEAGGAHLEVGAQRADGGGALLEVGLGVGHGAGPLGGVGLLGLEDRQRGVELGDPRLLAAQPLAELGGVGAQRVGLGGGVAAIGLDALEAVGGGGELGVVLVELAGQRRLAPGGPRRAASGRRAGSPRRATPRWWRPSARSRASSRAAPVAPAGCGAGAPAGGAEAAAVAA